MKRLTYIMFITALLSGLVSGTYAGERTYYFYDPGIRFGSEYQFSPLTLLLNGGYDILRNGGHENNNETIDIFTLDYRQGTRNVWDNITSPAYHISRYGWRRFLSNEVFPASLHPNKAQWVPNYFHHIVGSGMLYVRTAEWLDYHGYPFPRFLSFLSTITYQYLNESLENNHCDFTNVDPIADILIFNPLGFVVFSSDRVKRFFSKTIPMYDWSLQPVYNPWNRYLENAGLQFVFTWGIRPDTPYSLFFYYGIYGILGLSYSPDGSRHFSVGAGTVVNRLNENIIHNSRLITPTTDGAIGLFYDRDRSLLTSIVITGPRMYNVRMNVHPGLFSLKGFRPGMYLAFGEWDHFVFGFTLARFPFGILFEPGS